MELFQIPAQCCDAKHYLAMGEACASGDGCYDILRPMGAVYWFSIPYRLNLPLDVLVILHYLLAAISIILSTLAIQKIISLPDHEKDTGNYKLLALLMLFSALIHGIFLYPVINHSLSDPPSSLLFLIAIWLLFLLPKKILPRLLVLLGCGLLLGAAAWIRSFFLYPVLIALVLWMLHALLTRQVQFHKLVLFSALVPVTFQFYITWQKTGAMSYIHPSEAAIHQGMILSEKASGYDTVLPGIGFRSYPACENYLALGDAAKEFDLYSITCLMSGKLYYYLGTYSPKMFWDPEKDSANISHDVQIQTVNLHQETHQQIVAGKEKTVLQLKKIDPEQDAEIFYTESFNKNSKYFPSFSGWSNDQNQFLIFLVRSHNDRDEKITSPVLLDKEPKESVIGTYLHSDDIYDIVVKFPYISAGLNEETRRITADGSAINQGEIFITDIRLQEAEFKQERFWSPWLLIGNLLAILCALFLIQKKRKAWTSEHWMSFILISLCCAEALIITPEQRFIIAPMIALWILCIAFISRIILQRFLSSPLYGSV